MNEDEGKEVWQRIQAHDKEIATLKETVDLLMKGVFGLERRKEHIKK